GRRDRPADERGGRAQGARLPQPAPVRRDDRPADGGRDAVTRRLVGPAPQGAEGGGDPGGDGLRLDRAGEDQPGSALGGLTRETGGLAFSASVRTVNAARTPKASSSSPLASALPNSGTAMIGVLLMPT